MNKLANVVYAYSPKNDDELELKVGDKIEVLGFEEEGWWKGILKGRVGVFPSNFVQVIESGSSPTMQPLVASNTTNSSSQVNKMNIFNNKASTTKPNSISNPQSNSNNNTISNSNNNLTMNTQHQQDNSCLTLDDPSIISNDRKPKPTRASGYGDKFAASKPKMPDNSIQTGERLSANIVTTLQKPKKPPPPTPISENNNGNSLDQAPALPPKPANQFSPLLQHSMVRTLPPALQMLNQNVKQQSRVSSREQARVIYAYQPTAEDELAMEVDDVIDIIDKDIEDVGWWKGELRGRIGVFPDNFVQLIESSEVSHQDWPNQGSNLTHSSTSACGTTTTQSGVENKIKSVFSNTPKGFTKELENNLEKHNTPASFLSLKRNKLQQQSTTSMTTETTNVNENGIKEDTFGGSSFETNTSKLNHITANRAKGPSRRPPSNVLNKRNQSEQDKRESNGKDDSTKTVSLPASQISQSSTHDALSSLSSGQNTAPPIGLLSSKLNDRTPPDSIKPNLSLDNAIDNNQTSLTPKTSQRMTQPGALEKSKTSSTSVTPPWMLELRKQHAEKKRDGPSVTTPALDDEIPTKVPDLPSESPSSDRKPSIQSLKGVYTAPSTPTLGAVKNLSTRYSGDSSTSSETKRGNILGNNISNQESIVEPSPIVSRIGAVLRSNSPNIKTEQTPIRANQDLNEKGICNADVPTNNSNNAIKLNNMVKSDTKQDNISTKQPSNPLSAVSSKLKSTVGKNEFDKLSDRTQQIDQAPNLSRALYDDLLEQISKTVNSEISELRDEVKQLKEEFLGVSELKNVLEVMKIELRACQSATENQKRYIKELVNNLADERKKIAAMQTEIDRNLK